MHTVGDIIEQNGVKVRVTEVDADGNIVQTEPIAAGPAEPTPPDPADDAARLREENARLKGQIEGLRAAAPPSAAQPTGQPTADDPHAAEVAKLKAQYLASEIDDATYYLKLSRLGTRMELDAYDRTRTEAERRESVTARNNRKIDAYLQRYPAVTDAASAEFRRLGPHLVAASEELDLPQTDPRVQAIALERAFGPLRSEAMPDREFERRRHPVGGVPRSGGGDDTPAQPKAKSKGERIFDRLLPEYQQFLLQQRGSREAAIKTLEYADETLMQRVGRFAA